MKRFSKAICLALLVFTMIFALAGCSTAPKQDLGDIVIADVPVTEPAAEPAVEETPVAEAPAEQPAEETPVVEEPAVEEAPVAEEVAEETPVVEEAVVYVPVEKKYTLFTEGDITVVADKGKATITYPAEYISEADIDAAALAAFQAYSSVYDLSEVYYSVADGVLTLYYPESWGVEELALAEKTVMDVLPAYVVSVIADLVAAEETPVVEEPAVEEAPVAEEVAEETPVVEEAVEAPNYSASIEVFGYELDVEAYENVIEIKYPSFITFDEIKAAAAAAFEAYPQYLTGSTLYVDSASATAVLTLAATPSVEDLSYAVSLVENVLPAYVISVLSDNVEETVEAVAEVVDEVIAEVDAKVEEIEENGISASISLFGYEATISMKDDVITIDYPDFITVDEIKAAAALAYEAYSQYLEGSVLTIDDGYATLKLSFTIGKDEFNYAVNLLESELSYYISTVLGLVADAAEATATTEEVEVTEEPVVEEVAETVPSVFETSFNVLGYDISVVAYGNKISVTYPEILTNSMVATAARSAYEAYSQYFQGSELVIDNGTAVLTLAYDLTEDDFNLGIETLKSELANYILGFFTSSEETTEVAEEPVVEEPVVEETPVVEEPVAEPAVEETPVAEQPVAEAPAEQPAAEPAKDETPVVETKTETTTEPAKTETTTTTAVAEPAKKSNTGLIVLIVVLVVVAAAAVVLFLKKKKN